MITRDTKLYNSLFDKANKLLENHSEATQTNNYPITSIDQYFANLQFIKEQLQKMSIDDISYFMLPIEEPLFEINANTREISIPPAFAKGISVQGDEISETIFFSIDRYYDTTDFYSEYIIPIIQWKYVSDTGPNAYHLSAATSKAVIEDEDSKTGGTIKVVFGWPITSDVTEKAENIQFSVRFYTIVDAEGNLITEIDKYSEGTLEYSFSTLNAITKIFPSIDIFNPAFSFEYHNKNNLLWQRMRNSSNADLNFRAIAPIIEYFNPAEGKVVDLDENNKLVMAFKATYPSGTVHSRIGQQIYEIWRIDENGNEEIIATGIALNNGDNIIDEDFSFTYYETQDTERNTTDSYYQRTIDENDDIIFEEYDEPVLIKGLFKKAQTYIVDRAGEYKVKITNMLSSTNKESKETKTFEIALATIPDIDVKNEGVYNLILRFTAENGEVIPVSLSLPTVDNDGGASSLTYKWWRAETENGEKIALTENPSTDVEYSVSEPGYYFLEAINTRNNDDVSAYSTKGIRVTYPASEPTSFKYYWGNTKNFQLELSDDKDTVAPGAFTIAPSAERYDSFLYEWYQDGGNTILSNTDTIILTEDHIGKTYYCKVSSVYNGDKSEPVNTKKFTVIHD